MTAPDARRAVTPGETGLVVGSYSEEFLAECQRAEAQGYRRGVEAVKRAVLDIDAHATPFGEDDEGHVNGGYLISVGSLHRALGLVGHTAPKCPACCEQGCCRCADHNLDVDRLRSALIVARDFIQCHPAVRGEWPLVINVIENALARPAPRSDA